MNVRKTVLRNLLILVLVILPLWFMIAWLTGGGGGVEGETLWNALAMGFLMVAPQLFVAGVAQQVILMLLALALPPNRIVGMLSVAVIPLVLGMISAPLNVQFSTRFAVATLLGVAAFAFAQRVPLPPNKKE